MAVTMRDCKGMRVMPAQTGAMARTFRGGNGDAEHFLAITAPPYLGLAAQIEAIELEYAKARDALGLAPETAVFRRIFVSDVMNQAAAVKRSSLVADNESGPVAVSVVQQAPLPGAKLALFAYHVESGRPIVKSRLSPHHMLVEKSGVGHLWSTSLCATADSGPAATAAQTREVFDALIKTLTARGGTLRNNCVRTWIYLKDVDVFYQEMVESRRALFADEGLTANTHYLASTGIEGACAHRYDVVAMDAYSVLGLQQRQVSYLNDFERLCATKDYGVTFERGTRVGYADRAHHFISGTASIDCAGQVVHRGDVLRQLDHALDNVDALLRSGGGALDDLMHLTVYLRDPGDFAVISAELAQRLPDVPRVVVQAAVCRPDWLVEVEGVAVTNHSDDGMPVF